MKSCPKCGADLAELRPSSSSGQEWGWALCRRCGFPLDKDRLFRRIVAESSKLTEALYVDRLSDAPKKLRPEDALEWLREMIGSPVVPLYDGSSLVVFDIATDSLIFNFGALINDLDELAELLKA